MGKRVYLHIGWEKTGTSAIQVFCARNQGWLHERGFHYPLMGTLPQHAGLYSDLKRGYASRVNRSCQALRAEIEGCDQESVIFSHESLHSCSPAIFASIFRGCDVRVIAYVRRPDTAMISLFVTLVRFGEIPVDDLHRALRMFFRTSPGHFGYSWLGHFEYFWALEGFASRFGRDAMEVRHYCPGEMVGGQTVSDFMSLLGIDDLSGARWPDGQANLSLDADQFAIVLAFARSLRGMPGPLVRAHTRRLCDAMIAQGSPDRARSVERFVPVSLRQRLMGYWQDSFADLYDAYFGGRAIFADEPGGETYRPYQGMTPERLDELAGVIELAGVVERRHRGVFGDTLDALRR